MTNSVILWIMYNEINEKHFKLLVGQHFPDNVIWCVLRTLISAVRLVLHILILEEKRSF